MSTLALEHHLKPLLPLLNQPGVTELCINQPCEVFVEQQQQFQRHSLPELSLAHCEALAELIAEWNGQTLSAANPLLSGTLPSGERVQWVRPPACEKGKWVCAIRRHQPTLLTLEDYIEQGAFNATTFQSSTHNETLLALYRANNFPAFLTHAIASRKNIVISGGTGTGKTTFLNSCLQLISPRERLITLEDTREVKVTQPNSVHLLSTPTHPGGTSVPMLALFSACLRLRPDRILISELRGPEALAFLRAANSGHPGSLTTVHADTPQAAFEQLVFMLQQTGATLSEERLLRYIQSIIPIVVQLTRAPETGQFMRVSAIYYQPAQASG